MSKAQIDSNNCMKWQYYKKTVRGFKAQISKKLLMIIDYIKSRRKKTM